MNSAKEKAQELFNKYFLLHESATDENGVWILSVLNKGLAKKCALIAVDEMYDIAAENNNVQQVNYLVDVKQEIEKL
jgi:hypothetical protein